MNIRVSTLNQTNNAIANIQARNAQLVKYQDQISSGVRIARASDDPGSYPALAQARAAAKRLDSYTQTVGDATSVLNASVNALQDVNDVLVRARQIALEAGNATTEGEPTSREALATELDGLIGRALTAANSQPDGKTLFAGTAFATAPFRVATTDAAGRPATVVYDGSTDRTRTITGRGTTVDTRYVGSDVFQQPGADTFASLIALRDTLRGTIPPGSSYSQQITLRIGEVDAARTAIGEATGEQASNLATLDALQKLIGDARVDTAARASDLESTDYAEAVVKLKEQETALQAIYAVTAKQAQTNTGLLSFIG